LPSELSAKPQILLLGQYSTGKTSFIRKLIGCDYPGIHIGPGGCVYIMYELL
jgi:EH domain-containing protein 1